MADTVRRAHRALIDAEAKLTEAEAARDMARAMLDAALAAVGWTRLVGAFSPDAVAIYTHTLYPGANLHLGDVLEVLEQQAKATA